MKLCPTSDTRIEVPWGTEDTRVVVIVAFNTAFKVEKTIDVAVAVNVLVVSTALFCIRVKVVKAESY